MNTNWTKFGLGVYAFAALAGSASAQKASGAERGLIGVNLYDSGAKVVALYGSPDEIQAVSLSGGTTSSGSGFGGPGFGGAGGGPGSAGPAGRGAAPAGRGGGGGGQSSADRFGPFSFGDDVFRQAAPPRPSKGGGGLPPSGGPSGPAGGPGFAPPGAGGGFPGGGGATGGATETTQYTRWVYNRAGSKYGFIIDTQGHVVQIEAIGMQNNRVKTRKGLGFGATFAQLIKTYGNPDGYEVGGDTILVKYLVNKKVAFRLTRLGEKKPHVVTGVVVAAGKV